MLIRLGSEIYEKLDYSVKDVEDAVGAATTLSDDKVTVIMGRMRMPSLSLHGIEGAFYGPGAKTVIPASVSGKFSIRLVLCCLSLVDGAGTEGRTRAGSFPHRPQSSSSLSSSGTSSRSSRS